MVNTELWMGCGVAFDIGEDVVVCDVVLDKDGEVIIDVCCREAKKMRI